MVAMNDVTESGSIIFAKNSDRQPNEPLSIRYVPSAVHSLNSKLQTTYIEIDQIKKTNSCILFSPTNIFGAEMGFNSHGLVAGNEALFTKISSYTSGLTGMDIVRLILERCCTSEDGKNTIIELLQKYGQGGNCGFASSFYYHNSFLVVDSHEAWLIETVGKEYAAKRITSGIHTISNIISFGSIDTFDEYSDNLITQAISNGWCKSILDFHFQKCYSGISLNPKKLFDGFIKTSFSRADRRQCRSKTLIHQASIKSKTSTGLFSITDMFNLLRDHEQSKNSPAHGLMNVDLCMHAGFGPIRINQTTGALVSVIPTCNDHIPTHYATCTALTCLSVFKPIWLDLSSLPPSFISPTSSTSVPYPLLPSNATISNPSHTYSPNNLWWKSEVMTRNVMKHYTKLITQIQSERDLLESEITNSSTRLASKDVKQEERNNFSAYCFDKVSKKSTT
ncbi:unnamed protein product [Didymodactylos carnosus]|uniref:Peptidase C45 hydrolase domain-containing protein n=1 Tax=Didymodactylos carnosus TaxID=1234261 RepID=A0A8S2E6W7_9BILA|nr:unnamed protein product [Didymodactylos carnosus]CAF3953239.1 unnamed protein product [Didymodactylos carnosus]